MRRRELIAGALSVAALTIVFGPPALADSTTESAGDPTPADLARLDAMAPKLADGLPSIRGLWLTSPNTEEAICALFWNSGQYDNSGYTRICSLMRDWRQGVVMPMDPRLLHLLWAVQRDTKFTVPIAINSGFRTIRTNDSLLAEGAAQNSQHLHSRACDIAIPGAPPEEVAERAARLQIGGVGHYPSFTHVDCGPVRSWRG